MRSFLWFLSSYLQSVWQVLVLLLVSSDSMELLDKDGSYIRIMPGGYLTERGDIVRRQMDTWLIQIRAKNQLSIQWKFGSIDDLWIKRGEDSNNPGFWSIGDTRTLLNLGIDILERYILEYLGVYREKIPENRSKSIKMNVDLEQLGQNDASALLPFLPMGQQLPKGASFSLAVLFYQLRIHSDSPSLVDTDYIRGFTSVFDDYRAANGAKTLQLGNVSGPKISTQENFSQQM